MPVIPNPRPRDLPTENAAGEPLAGTPDSFVGLKHKQADNVGDVYQPYAEDYAEQAGMKPGIKPALQGPNEQSIVASGMTVEEWKVKHPKAVLGPNPEDIGQVTTDPPDGAEPEKRPMEEEETEDAPAEAV